MGLEPPKMNYHTLEVVAFRISENTLEKHFYTIACDGLPGMAYSTFCYTGPSSFFLPGELLLYGRIAQFVAMGYEDY